MHLVLPVARQVSIPSVSRVKSPRRATNGKCTADRNALFPRRNGVREGREPTPILSSQEHHPDAHAATLNNVSPGPATPAAALLGTFHRVLRSKPAAIP